MPPTAMEQFATQVGLRVKAAREAMKLTQEELSRRPGFNDRQTLAAIEAGNRKVSAEELMRFMQALGRDLDYFTDPFRLVAEARFSFRAKGAGDGQLDAFEETAGQWVAFWRDQARRRREAPGPLQHKLRVTDRSSFEEAQAAGEQLVDHWKLGDVPALRLVPAIEEHLHMLVLAVDMPDGVSGAACQVPGADTVFVNRRESERRRHFDLAHELFHVLTWDAMPPERVDREHPKGYKAKRIEQLADNFAGALLMPRAILSPAWEARKAKGVSLQDWFAATTAQLRVSALALQARLLSLEYISSADLLEVNTEALAETIRQPPPPFSRRFMERAAEAIERGEISVMRLARLLQTTGIGGLEQLFREHGMAVPFEM